MIPSPALQERTLRNSLRALLSLRDFAAMPRRKQVVG